MFVIKQNSDKTNVIEAMPHKESICTADSGNVFAAYAGTEKGCPRERRTSPCYGWYDCI